MTQKTSRAIAAATAALAASLGAAGANIVAAAPTSAEDRDVIFGAADTVGVIFEPGENDIVGLVDEADIVTSFGADDIDAMDDGSFQVACCTVYGGDPADVLRDRRRPEIYGGATRRDVIVPQTPTVRTPSRPLQVETPRRDRRLPGVFKR